MCGRPLPGLGSHKHRSCIRYLDSSAHPVCRTGLVVTIVDRPRSFQPSKLYSCVCMLQGMFTDVHVSYKQAVHQNAFYLTSASSTVMCRCVCV